MTTCLHLWISKDSDMLRHELESIVRQFYGTVINRPDRKASSYVSGYLENVGTDIAIMLRTDQAHAAANDPIVRFQLSAFAGGSQLYFYWEEADWSRVFIRQFFEAIATAYPETKKQIHRLFDPTLDFYTLSWKTPNQFIARLNAFAALNPPVVTRDLLITDDSVPTDADVRCMQISLADSIGLAKVLVRGDASGTIVRLNTTIENWPKIRPVWETFVTELANYHDISCHPFDVYVPNTVGSADMADVEWGNQIRCVIEIFENIVSEFQAQFVPLLFPETTGPTPNTRLTTLITNLYPGHLEAEILLDDLFSVVQVCFEETDELSLKVSLHPPQPAAVPAAWDRWLKDQWKLTNESITWDDMSKMSAYWLERQLEMFQRVCSQYQTAVFTEIPSSQNTPIGQPVGITIHYRRSAAEHRMSLKTEGKIAHLRDERWRLIRETGSVPAYTKLLKTLGIDPDTVQKHAEELVINWHRPSFR